MPGLLKYVQGPPIAPIAYAQEAAVPRIHMVATARMSHTMFLVAFNGELTTGMLHYLPRRCLLPELPSNLTL